MGFCFDEEYIKRTYNVEGKLIKELLSQESKTLKDNEENKKALFENKAKLESFEEDFIDKGLEQKEYLKVDETMANFFKEQFEKTIKESKNYDEVFEKLQGSFSSLKQVDFEKYLYMSLVNSNIFGYLED